MKSHIDMSDEEFSKFAYNEGLRVGKIAHRLTLKDIRVESKGEIKIINKELEKYDKMVAERNLAFGRF